MYDAIVIGARCAGAVTAMLLARSGHRVLLLERGAIPSDVHRGHFIHRHGPKRLADWGLLERIVATNCPPLTTHLTDFGDFPLIGRDIRVGNVAWDMVRDGASSTKCWWKRRLKLERNSARTSSWRAASGTVIG